jgi:cytochrome c oxidase cbb3-type subunit IV
MMDLNDIRALVTVLSLGVFLGIVAWAWSARRRSAFEAAAQLPFADTMADAQFAEERS